MVMPERELARPDVAWVNVTGLGSDALLQAAIVTLDNRAYVPEADAREWSAETEDGVARFVDLSDGTYDVKVQPRRSSSTPAWESTAVTIFDSYAMVAFEGIPFEVLLDWPELDDFEIDPADINVSFQYRLPDPDRDGGTYTAEQRATAIGGGEYAGSLPWVGRYPVEVEVSQESFRLRYNIPDSVAADGSTPIEFLSPLHRQPVTLEAAGEPIVSTRVKIEHGYSIGIRYGDYYLAYEFEPTGVADSLYLLTPAVSGLAVTWVEGRTFLPRYRYLSEDQMAPGTINLGDFVVDLLARDANGQPVAASFEIFLNEFDTVQWSAGPGGVLKVLLHADSYLVKVRAGGYEQLSSVIDITGDAAFVFELEAEQ